MLSVIIATDESERALVATLAALVPGATAGAVREVIVADKGSRDPTAEAAEHAGCRAAACRRGPRSRRLADVPAARHRPRRRLDPGGHAVRRTGGACGRGRA